MYWGGFRLLFWNPRSSLGVRGEATSINVLTIYTYQKKENYKIFVVPEKEREFGKVNLDILFFFLTYISTLIYIEVYFDSMFCLDNS